MKETLINSSEPKINWISIFTSQALLSLSVSTILATATTKYVLKENL